MSRILVFTNPAHDRPTEYIGAWCDRVVELAKKQPETVVIELSGPSVTRVNIETAISENDPQIVFFNGHGGPDHLCGYNREILIRVGENAKIMQGKFVHALACDAGEKLGPEIINLGGKCFIGYKKNFQFVHLNKQTKQEQLEDKVAEFFLDPAFKVIESMILGDSAEIAFLKSQGLYREKLLLLTASNDPDFNTTLASRLYHDLINQVLLGGSQATLV